MGPRAPKPLEATEELVFLCHAPCVTLSRERLIEPCPRGSAGEPLSLVVQGVSSYAQALASTQGREEAKKRVQAPIDREPKAWSSPRALSDGGDYTWAWPDSLA
jgi:hypothetical protein